jgi:hypothetical protein
LRGVEGGEGEGKEGRKGRGGKDGMGERKEARRNEKRCGREVGTAGRGLSEGQCWASFTEYI